MNFVNEHPVLTAFIAPFLFIPFWILRDKLRERRKKAAPPRLTLNIGGPGEATTVKAADGSVVFEAKPGERKVGVIDLRSGRFCSRAPNPHRKSACPDPSSCPNED